MRFQSLNASSVITLALASMLALMGCSKNPEDKFRSQHIVLPPTVVSFENRDTWLLSHNFEFVNRSSQDLKLKVQSTTCGCTACNIEKPVLRVGETSKIEVFVAVPYNRAYRTESVFIETGVADEILSFSLSADVFPAVSIHPFQRQIYVTKLGPVAFDVVVYSKKEVKDSDLAIDTSSGAIKTLIADPIVKDLGTMVRKTYPVTVQILSEFEKEATITIDSGIHTFPVVFRFHRQPNVTISPMEVLFPKMSLGEIPSDPISIALTGKTAFEVTKVVWDRELIEIEVLTANCAIKHELGIRRVNKDSKKVNKSKTVAHISIQVNGVTETIDLPVYFVQ